MWLRQPCPPGLSSCLGHSPSPPGLAPLHHAFAPAMPTSPHQARKQPRQARAKATVDALLEACGQVLERHGLQGLNTNRVAERAGASIGSLYQYFPAKEALLQALADRERARLLAELVRLSGTAPLALPPQETASQDPLCDSLEAMVEAGLRHQFERPVMAQALEAHEFTPASQAATVRMNRENTCPPR